MGVVMTRTVGENFVTRQIESVKGYRHGLKPPAQQGLSLCLDYCSVSDPDPASSLKSSSTDDDGPSGCEEIILKNQWAVLDFSDGKIGANFVSNIMKYCSQLEVPFINKGVRVTALSNAIVLEDALREVIGEAPLPALVLCAMPDRRNGYKTLKWIAETKLGLMTQCFLVDSANVGGDKYLANLALKINAKLGGSNVDLMDPFKTFSHTGDAVMFIGAEVKHPAAAAGDEMGTSIAAVVGTLSWPAANRYGARVFAQHHKQEGIQGFGDTCLELARAHYKATRKFPTKIFIFRGGVSDGQSDKVLKVELADVIHSFENCGHFPKITVIVAHKLHKQIRYRAFPDQLGLPSDQLEKLISDLRLTSARCNKTLSLVPPLYYAHLVAVRGRIYYEVALSQGTTIFKLHRELENTMFFV